jgi:hypothetical protein
MRLFFFGSNFHYSCSMFKKLLIVFFFVASAQIVVAQDTIQRLVQLSGVVISNDSLNEMPYAAVYNKSVKRGTIADIYGFFSLVVQPGDTLLFKYYGHKPSRYIVPDTLKDDRYSIIHMMEIDTIQLEMVVIYPWPSKEAFAQAFVDMDPYEDALLRAQRQLSGRSLEALAGKVSGDASIASSYALTQNNTRLYNMNQSPVNNLMNPFAWAQFLQKWRTGELKRM